MCNYWIKNRNLELQFWGYELGNVLAAIAGVGGLLTVFDSFVAAVSSAGVLDRTLFDQMASVFDTILSIFRQQPDIAVTLGIGFIVLVSPLFRRLMGQSCPSLVVEIYDYFVVGLAMTVLIYALRTDTSWITVSGSSFVVASALLRYARNNPIFLKLGGLFLQSGGFALGMFGISLIAVHSDQLEIILGCLTIATGYYVCAAGMLTYLGGKYETDDYGNNRGSRREREMSGSYRFLIHPTSGLLSRFFVGILDRPYCLICKFLVNPSIFWVRQNTKDNKPFTTSMAARLPWRFLTGGAALAIGTDAGVTFALANLFWAIGDVAIGSIDWENKVSIESESVDNCQVLSSCAAVLLLPGSSNSKGVDTILVSRLELNQLNIGQFLDLHSGRTNIHSVRCDGTSASAFPETLRSHLFSARSG